MSTTAAGQLLALLEDYRSLNPKTSPSLPFPTPVQFSKQVSKGLPCVYLASTAAEGLPSNPAHGWTRKILVRKVTEPVEVAVTPDGRADSIHLSALNGERLFLQPANVLMTMSGLLERLSSSSLGQLRTTSEPVYYLQSQNGNLTSTPLAPLMADLPGNFPFAEEVLGEPEAINIWIGDSQSVTSVHRDPYENLYWVIKGSKTFTLWPPVEEFTLQAEMVRTGHYDYNDTTTPASFTVALDECSQREGYGKIPWVPIDPSLPRDILEASYPLYRHAHPQIVHVPEGQMLYLPAGWFHHVSQACGEWSDGTQAPCVAVNYWYDQDYEGEKYTMRQLIGRLIEQAKEEKWAGLLVSD